MARYIDAEKIKYTKFIPENDPFDGAGGLCALKSHIDAIPAADVVEVVRCGDCVHRDPEDKKCDGAFQAKGGIFQMDDDDFCSYGERRKENGEIY